MRRLKLCRTKITLGWVIFMLAHALTAATDFEDSSNGKRGKIQGIVRDAQTGKLLGGANVVVSGTLLGTTTSAEGNFSLNIAAGSYTLTVRYIGYTMAQQQVAIAADNTLHVDFRLKPSPVELPQAVVTGTRSEKVPEDAPIPAQVVSQSHIARAGLTDLRDVLAEQPGLNIVQDFSGRGVQIQGLDPDYALILIDGSPVIGRTAGTLDLTRFAVGNLERVEIVKGPNSSLYGSEALAGVINLITRVPRAPLQFNFSGKLGEQTSRDISAGLETRRRRFGGHFFYNLKSRNHFDLNPLTDSWTLPEYTDHTFSMKLSYQFNDRTELTFNGRLFRENVLGRVGLAVDSTTVVSDDRARLTDWNIAPILTWHLSPLAKLTGKIYWSRYTIDTRLAAQNGGNVFDDSRFDQDYRQVEAQFDAVLSARHLFKAGGSAILESVEADRITSGRRRTQNYVAFAQHEWIPRRMLDVVASARVDVHSEYDVHFSPKLSALWRVNEKCRVRAGVGSGFKSPTFSQLYLDFTNPQVGYSIFGSSNVAESVQRLLALGQIRELPVDPAVLARLKPESSWAYNVSLDLQPWKALLLRANVFRNDVSNLIEAQAIGAKVNGQNVFTYFNLHRVFTQGIESEAQIELGERVELALGYQYVIAKDKDVVDHLERGEITKKGTSGRIRPVQPEEYSGLFNRSRNSGTARLSLKLSNGAVLNVRGILRGRFGLFDLNGNLILDDASEYAAPYAILNLHASWPLNPGFEFSAGAENLLNYIDARSLAGTPGRLIYAKLGLNWKKENKVAP